jgi:peptide/nickel transport system permease protein
VILTLLGRGIVPLSLAVGIALIASHARLTRSAVIQVRSMAYIEAAQAVGASRWHILRAYILPNIQPTLLAYTAVIFSYSILNGAALSFLGLGSEPGVPDWGAMLYENRATLLTAPWASLAPGVAITLTVLAANALADGMRR